MSFKTIRFISLGCAKNTVDTEILMGHINRNSEIKILNEFQDGIEDTVIINTCGFILDAKEESINTIIEQVERKKRGEIKNIIVFGCLVQRYLDDLKKEIPEVDYFFGVDKMLEIAKIINKNDNYSINYDRTLTTPSHYAYLKIADGCNRNCSFCAIPSIKGKHVSRPIESLLDEAKKLSEKGVKEIILISQELNSYGIDIYKKQMLAELVEKLSDSNLFKWIRLHYLYPTSFPQKLIELIATRDNICKYIDIPLQHINTQILKSMNRACSEDDIQNLLENFRKNIPGVSIRTTFIVGYPTEKEIEFKQLYNFTKLQKFDRMGAFAFSAEENTAAYEIEDKTKHSTKLSRLDRLMKLQANISFDINLKKIGKIFEVIIDSENDEFYIGRTQYDSPEIDNEVFVKKTKKLSPGDFVNVKIENASNYFLEGKIC